MNKLTIILIGLVIACIIGIIYFSIFIGIGIRGLEDNRENFEQRMEEERKKAEMEAEMRLPKP